MENRKAIALLLLIAIVILTGCSKPSEEVPLGEVQDTQVSEYEEKEASLFNRYFPGHDYKCQTLYSKLAGLKLEVPESWSISRENARYYRITTPPEDPLLPGTDIHMLFCINTNIGAASPSQYDEIFDAEKEGLLYDLEKGTFFESYSGVPAEKFLDDRITEDPALLSCSIYQDVEMTGTMGSTIDYDAVSIRYNFLAGKTPVTIRTVVNEEDKEAACELLAMLTSSFSLYEPSSPSLLDAELAGIKMQLPDDFQKQQINGTEVYKASEYEDSLYSGMSIMVTELNQEEFDGYEFSKGPLKSIGGCFVPYGKYTCMYSIVGSTEEILVGGTLAGFAVSNFTYHQKEALAGSYLGTSGDGIIFIYMIPQEGSKKAICFFFKPYQAEEAAYIDQLIREKTKIVL